MLVFSLLDASLLLGVLVISSEFGSIIWHVATSNTITVLSDRECMSGICADIWLMLVDLC